MSGGGEELVKQAQRLSGGLLWLSRRTRPDIAFGGSQLSAVATRQPKTAIQYGKRLLRYLRGTTKVGINLRSSADMGLKVYADASFRPIKSQTGCALMWGWLSD